MCVLFCFALLVLFFVVGACSGERLQQERASHLFLHAQGCRLSVEVGRRGGAPAAAAFRAGAAPPGTVTAVAVAIAVVVEKGGRD